MIDFAYRIPHFYLFCLLACSFILLSIIGIWIVNRTIPFELRYKDNEVIVSISALISIIFGVFAGLIALYLINNITYASDAVQREANAVANIYRHSKWLKEPTQIKVQAELRNYLSEVIHVEWPAMKKGKSINNDGDLIIERINKELHQYGTFNDMEVLVMRDILQEMRNLYDAREHRIHMSSSELNSEIWIVIFIGALLTVGVNFLFGTNIYLHMGAVCAAAFMAASMIFLLLTLDRPFQGDFIIEANAQQSVLDSISNPENTKLEHSPASE